MKLPTLTDCLGPIFPAIEKWATVVLVEGSLEKPEFVWHHYKDQPQATNFWPASCVKLYTAIAAILRIKEVAAAQGQQLEPLETTVTLEHRDEKGVWVLDTARTLRESLSEVFRRSSNEDYTFHLRICGLDWLNAAFFLPERGFTHTALMRGYVTGRPSVYRREEAQRVTVTSPRGVRFVYDHAWSGKSFSEAKGASIIDAKTGNVTTTRDLAECLRRLLFQEEIPQNERFGLSAEERQFLLHGHLGHGLVGLQTTGPESGPSAWKNGLDAVFPRAKFYHKTGSISNFGLEVAYLDDFNDSGRRFLLVPVCQAGISTKPLGDDVIAAMSRAIGEWVRGQ